MLLYELQSQQHWDKVYKTMQKAGYTELGSGVDSTVWGKDAGSVIKILMPERGDLAPAEKVFLAYYKIAQQNKSNPHFMKFVDIGGQHYTKFDIDGEAFYQIAVEKLQPLPDGSFEEAVVWAMSESIGNRQSWPDALKQLSNPASKVWQYYEGDANAIVKRIAASKQKDLKKLQYLYLTMQLMYQIGRKQGFAWDLHTENAMMRGDGTIVITDPWYNSMINENFTQGVAEGQLDEISQDTARSYAQKATQSKKDLINQTYRKGADTDALNKKIQNRQQGLNRAHTDKRYYKDEQGVAEGSEGSVSFRDMIDVVDQHYPSYYAELSGSDISDKQFERAIVNAYNKIMQKQGVAESLDAEAYKEKLLATLPQMMRFYEKNVQGWKPSKDEMLAAIETGYTVMKHTGDVKQAGRAVMDELKTLHRMSKSQQGTSNR
jgi:hypothetical protein